MDAGDLLCERAERICCSRLGRVLKNGLGVARGGREGYMSRYRGKNPQTIPIADGIGDLDGHLPPRVRERWDRAEDVRVWIHGPDRLQKKLERPQ